MKNPKYRDIPVDPLITPKLFLQWRSPRLGSSNPEQMANPVWKWLVRSRVNAWKANKLFGGPDDFELGPCWCFDRMGHTETLLPDGREVLISGEHEDSYDSDFHIYNDVVVLHPSGQIDIFGYPSTVFPPTDFHSATLVDNHIVVLGNFGYPKDRIPNATQVLILDLSSFAVSLISTSGDSPGWLHKHTATLTEDKSGILVRHGKVDRGPGSDALVENIDDWRLDLKTWKWERMTQRNWLRWNVLRADGGINHLWEIEQALWERKMKSPNKLKEKLKKLEEELGAQPDLDVFARLFHPPVPHDSLEPSEDKYNVHRIRSEGVIIRYVDVKRSVQITVEGDLAQPLVEAVTSDLVSKVSALENTPCVLKPI